MPLILTSEHRANQSVAGNQLGGLIFTSAGDDVLALWYSPLRRAQMFDSDGNMLGREIALPTVTSTAAWLPNGELAVFTDSAGLQLQRFDRTATPDGSAVTIAAAGKADDLVVLASGNLLATYRVGNQIRGRILDSAFAPLGSELLLRDVGTDRLDETVVTALAGGGFSVLFDFGSKQANHLYLFNANGNQLATPTTFPLAARNFDAVSLADGGLLVAYTQGLAPQSQPLYRFLNANGSTRASGLGAMGSGDSNPNVTLIAPELTLLIWHRFEAGQHHHYGQLLDIDGRKLGAELHFGGSDAPGFDVHALDERSLVTIEMTNAGAGGYGIDPVVKYWEIDNLAYGTAGSDNFSGIGPDMIMLGRAGNDFYHVDGSGDLVIEWAGGGTDRVFAQVSYTLNAGAAVEYLTTADNLGTAPLNLTGNEFAQFIYGNAGANILTSGPGSYSTRDVLTGFAGDDTFVVNASGDEVRELANEGIDRVLLSPSYTSYFFRLTPGASVEFLSADPASTKPISLTGNEFSQEITGGAGDNDFEGGGGGDVLIGLTGNDEYYIYDARDEVREAAGQGFDTVYVVADINFTLGAGQHVEFIVGFGTDYTGALNLTGNELAQNITGNLADNVLTSGGGADFLKGWYGDDTYVITPDAILEEFVGEGNDRVKVSGSYTLAAIAEIEMLTTTDNLGSAAIDLTGNGFTQFIYGNAGVNRLNGGGGGDVLVGLEGNDLYYIVNAHDQVRETTGGGSDRLFASVSYTLNAAAQVEIISTADNLGTQEINLTGNELAQYVFGNAGDNRLGGGAGRDVLIGLGGEDEFLFNTALNTAFTPSFNALGASANVDRIDGFAADDKIMLDGSLFGFTRGALPAGAFNTGTAASEADDRILYDAGSGALLFDADGAGGAAAQLIAFISNPFNLDASFIIVV